MVNTRRKINRKSKKNKSKRRSVKKNSGGIKTRRRRVVGGGLGQTSRTFPSSVFLNETWNNGTKTLSGTYVRDGTHNSKPVYILYHS